MIQAKQAYSYVRIQNMEDALKHLEKTDPKLYSIAAQIELKQLIKPPDYFIDLIESII
jgi:hypothetical protein